MKKFLIASAAFAAFWIAPVYAADMPVKVAAPVVAPLFNWSGFYIGINGGAGRLTTDWTSDAGITTGKFSGSGGLVGGTVGWNFQASGSPWVFGIEADWDWSSIKPDVVSTCPVSCSEKLRDLVTVRARFGYAASGSLLAYVTGGWAYGNFQPTLVAVPGTNDYHDSGWTLGGGLEAALGSGWSLKGEYLYIDFGRSQIFFPPTGLTSDPHHLHVVRLGLNYRFGDLGKGPVVAKY